MQWEAPLPSATQAVIDMYGILGLRCPRGTHPCCWGVEDTVHCLVEFSSLHLSCFRPQCGERNHGNAMACTGLAGWCTALSDSADL